MKIKINQVADSIITHDIVIEMSGGNIGSANIQLETPVSVERMHFQLTNNQWKIIDLGTVSLTPTIKNNVNEVLFDQEGRGLRLLDSGNAVLHSTSTDQKTVIVSVNFSTRTVTVFE